MQLKNYQKAVIADLTRYLELLNHTENIAAAYRTLWEEKGIPVGENGVPHYRTILPQVPDLCFKVPTGGGKTFLACNAIKPVFDALPVGKAKAVVWLVPSDAILEQTLKALRNPAHPYRQKINTDFNNRVEVYTKEELLAARNFNIAAVTEQLSIMVLSYDSFRGRKEMLKAKQENSVLEPMAQALGKPLAPIEDADETALIQIINQLSPLVIVDESQHARSTLSKQMLQNFNPCFVLDLTATPTEESNVISFVDAALLKKENMVKLPVIVYNRNSREDVIADAVDLRNRLEQEAVEEQKVNGRYIRPIVLFQAQPKVKEDSATFSKLKEKLVEAGIPEEQIAIKTADINELKNTDLLSSDCKIRYIITVNALKEGWDCPFAYILASLANRTSRVDVEQILGRVLRQPYTVSCKNPYLNMSYVLTSSNDFRSTLDDIVKGLNSAGFSRHDCRIAAQNDENNTELFKYEQITFSPESSSSSETEDANVVSDDETKNNDFEDDFINVDTTALSERLHVAQTTGTGQFDSNGIASLLSVAVQQGENFNQAINEVKDDDISVSVPEEVKEKMPVFHMNAEYEEEAKAIVFPQFFYKHKELSFFPEGDWSQLEKENLSEEFTLKGKPSDIDFNRADDEIFRIDINNGDANTPKVTQMNESDQRYFREQFSKLPDQKKLDTCAEIILKQVDKLDGVSSGDLKTYVDRVIGEMDEFTVDAMEKAPLGFAARISAYIKKLIEDDGEKQFKHWIETGRIECRPNWHLPDTIIPAHFTNTYSKSLYEAEEEVNGFEYKMVTALTSIDSVKWWHRNIARREFCINGFINHYPDFIVMMTSGKVLLIETKGDQLENEESRQKIRLGAEWAAKAGNPFRYYMVFESKDLQMKGAYQFDEFLNLLKEM